MIVPHFERCVPYNITQRTMKDENSAWQCRMFGRKFYSFIKILTLVKVTGHLKGLEFCLTVKSSNNSLAWVRLCPNESYHYGSVNIQSLVHTDFSDVEFFHCFDIDHIIDYLNIRRPLTLFQEVSEHPIPWGDALLHHTAFLNDN